MEELKEGAREKLFFALLMCSRQTLLAFLLYASVIPQLSLSHHLCEVSTAARHSVVDFEFFSPSDNCVCVCVELDYRGGAA